MKSTTTTTRKKVSSILAMILCAALTVIDSETYAGAWAVLSTDSGSDMILNVYDEVIG